MPTPDADLLKIIVDSLEVCKSYKPRFGYSQGLTLSEFQTLYGSDPFYSWFGLDSPLLYAAHKAAGGMTSVYRQLGIGCQRVFQRVLMDALGLTVEEAAWSYQISKGSGREQSLSLDSRIPVDAIETERLTAVSEWLYGGCKEAGVSEGIGHALKGAVF